MLQLVAKDLAHLHEPVCKSAKQIRHVRNSSEGTRNRRSETAAREAANAIPAEKLWFGGPVIPEKQAQRSRFVEAVDDVGKFPQM